MCNKLATNEDAYRCDTCNHWSHLVCSGTNNSLQRSFEWICLKSNCSPNHVEVTPKTGSENQLVSPNRYRLIEKVNENLANLHQVRQRSPKTKFNKVEYRPKENENLVLLNELPKILPEDYEGKDLCRSCYKEVKQQAISCDTCHQWTHRTCSDMSYNIYIKCRKLKHFLWICNKCRCDEVEITDKVNLAVLKPSELPEEVSAVKILKERVCHNSTKLQKHIKQGWRTRPHSTRNRCRYNSFNWNLDG